MTEEEMARLVQMLADEMDRRQLIRDAVSFAFERDMEVLRGINDDRARRHARAEMDRRWAAGEYRYRPDFDVTKLVPLPIPR